ncbi:MAG: glycoside hydrolase 43 family protein [Firmicutes bacterium]|nr:glycoside hydrolase 43 family protein [Bacillota bacterium]
MAADTFINPFIYADVPDPSVIRVGDTYYMTSTTMYFTPGCPVMKSKDLVNWEIVNYVYDTLSDIDHMALRNGKHDYGRGSWASSLRYHNGTFYVSFVAYNTNTTYIFQTEDIENGPWRRYDIEGIYHDMSLLFDDGRVYMVYGAGAIRLVELTADATAIKPNGLNKVIIEHADITGGKSLAEGAHIYKLDGKYYIFIIAWPRTGTRRRIEICYRANAIDGEYEGRIVLDDNLGFQNAGVAQGGIVDTPCGKWYAMLFQDHGSVGRIPVLVPVSWQDGWPIFGEDGEVPIEMPYPSAPHLTAPLVVSDDFDGDKLPLQWQWNHNPDNTGWSLTARKGWLRLTTTHVIQSLVEARNTLTQRTFGPACSGSVLLDTGQMKDGDVAGFAALAELYGFVGVKMEDGQKSIIMATSTDTMEVVPLTQDQVRLKIDFNFTDAIDEANFYYSLCGSKWKKIGGTLKMRYTLAHFTGYRFALFNYATESTGGYVDFDWFLVQ